MNDSEVVDSIKKKNDEMNNKLRNDMMALDKLRQTHQIDNPEYFDKLMALAEKSQVRAGMSVVETLYEMSKDEGQISSKFLGIFVLAMKLVDDED